MTPIFTDGTDCKIEVQMVIYNPNFDNPIDFPARHIAGPITSTRSVNLGSSSLSIPLKSHSSYKVYIGGNEEYIPYNKIFSTHSVVHLKVKRNNLPFRKLNAGVITSKSMSVSPSGNFNFTFNLKTKDHFIQENEIFFDLKSVDESGQTRSEENIEGAISGMAEMLQESKSIRDTMNILWDKLLCKFLLGKVLGGVKKFGGVNLLSETDSDDSSLLKLKVTPKSYTENFIHITQFMSSINIGQTVNLLDIMKSYSSAPMYELFIDSLESVGGDEDSPENSGSLSNDIDSYKIDEKYSVKQEECVLVFRQTPFSYFDSEGKWNSSQKPFYHLKFGETKKISTQDSYEDYKSGVHVSLSVYEAFSLVMNFPKYNSTLMKIFGKKMLNVKLAGLTGKKDPTKKEKEELNSELDKIRDLLFGIFCNPKDLKTLNLNIDIPFNFVRIGVPLYLDYEDSLTSYESSTGFYGYIETVVDTIDPAGKANTSLKLKWGVDPLNYFDDEKKDLIEPPSEIK